MTFTVPTELLLSVQNTKFNRNIAHGLYGNLKNSNQQESLYTASEIKALEEHHVQDRLAPRATAYYRALAQKVPGILNLIKARPEETDDLEGEKDPSNQLRYSPVDGLLHKYELVLLYVVRTCSSWCRYCYRSDFLTLKTEKDIANIDEIGAYITNYNEEASRFNQKVLNSEDKKILIKEALLSGGDPMVLSNKNLFAYMYGLAKAGVKTIRIGTKELAFFPYRFDDNFFTMLDRFHEMFPKVNLAFMVHFSHPGEFLETDEQGEYVFDNEGNYKRIEVTERAVERLRSRAYITLENQTPIIDGVNDDPDLLRLLQIELKKSGINNHYFFQCREIEGHKIFAVPVEKTWAIHTDSQKGLSGIEKSRLCLSTEAGKIEVISVVDKFDVNLLGPLVSDDVKKTLDALLGDGIVIFKFHRTPKLSRQGDLIIAKRNPKALWISGYEDRIIYDSRRGVGSQFDPLIQLVQKVLGIEKEESISLLDEGQVA